MSWITSINDAKSKKIFLTFFALASLFPILIAIFLFYQFILPLFGPAEYSLLPVDIYLGLGAMLFFPLLSFFLMYRWLHSLESVTAEIASKTNAVTRRSEEFAGQKIEQTSEYASSTAEEHPDENEIQSLIRSFNNIFQTAADQLAERNHLQDLLAKLIGISSSLTSELEFDRLFPMIIGNVTVAMNAERTSLYVVDWDTREIWTKVSEGVGQIRLPLGHGISGRVAETGETINVADAWELPSFDRSFDERNHFRTRSVLCMPIVGRFNKTIGVLQVINKQGGGSFNAEDEIFMKGLTSQIGIALENSLLVDELKLSFTSSVSTLSAVVDSRHPFTAGHSERVTVYSELIAKTLNFNKEEMEVIQYAAILHDIGKIGIRDEVLMKNGPYTPEDWVEMKSHPLKTKNILLRFHFPRNLRQVPEIACRHHEKIDGTGYPEGLTGDQIPLGAKILAVADVFDALTSQRDYPKYAFGESMSSAPMPLSKVIALMKNEVGSHFDPLVVDALIECLPHALVKFRGEHFSPAYVDETIRQTAPDLLPR